MSKKSRLLQLKDNEIWRNLLYNLVLGRISWDGLPDGLTSRQLELFICRNMAIGFRHDIVGATLLPAYWGGRLNIYGLPTKYVAFGYNEEMPSYDVPASDAVPFYDNPSQRGILSMVDDTAKQLALIWETIALNTSQQKNPWVFAGSEDEIQSLKAGVRAVAENQFAYFTTPETRALLDETQHFFPLNTPYIANDLFTQFRQTLNTLLTNLGVDNMPIEKKERQLADEVHGNQSLVMYYRDAAMRSRQDAADQFNDKFGTKLKPVWRGCTDCESPITNKGGEDNGTTI